MADMDTVVIRDREDMYIHATLGPRGHELSRSQLYRMVLRAMKDAEDDNAREVDLTF